MCASIFFFVVICVTLIWSSQGLSSKLTESKRVLNQILDDYDSRILPSNSTGGPLDVKINILIVYIDDISEYDMEYTTQLYVRQEWTDERLKYEEKDQFKYVTVTETNKLWTPDLFVSNEKDALLHKMVSPNTVLRVQPSGQVLFSSRVSLTLWCYMNLDRYPFDSQICQMTFYSYAYTADTLLLSWDEQSPVQMSRDVRLTGFELSKMRHSTCSTKTSTGEYSCLKVEFLLHRQVRYYVHHVYLPSSLLVALSWISMWIPPQAAESRLLLAIAPLFALSSLSADEQSGLPPWPHLTALDLWLSTCHLLLFAVLLQNAFVTAAAGRPQDGKEQVSAFVKRASLVHSRLRLLLAADSDSLDGVSRRVFPCVFLCFSTLYFFYYSILIGDSWE